MPLGIERINVRRRSPNELINFITPLEGSDKAIAQDFLERIAAIVYPIMKENQLAVMSLDEFPPNLEFWGRNFDAGACIQLVLRHPKTGLWLPFAFVQGVMIHELAHIKQMNHSRAFWAVRNSYALHLERLHARSYTGEGFWSAGRTLISSALTIDRPLAESELPTSLCGGTYRSRRGKRNTGPSMPKLTYAEQKKRRIEKKFGSAEGYKVGTTEDVKKGPAPRVAKSNRGRELRATAVLKRLEAGKTKKDEEEGNEEEDDQDDAVNVGGGRFLVAVSGNEDDQGVKKDMDKELLQLIGGARGKGSSCGTGSPLSIDLDSSGSEIETENGQNMKRKRSSNDIRSAKEKEQHSAGVNDGAENVKRANNTIKKPSTVPKHNIGHSQSRKQDSSISTPIQTRSPPPVPLSKQHPLVCGVCSVENAPHTILCDVCMNVLEPELHPNLWTCWNPSCPPQYRNSADLGLCGVCGQRRK